MYQGAYRCCCILAEEIVQLCVTLSKDLYNIDFKGVVIIAMSSERIYFPQRQALTQVVNVIKMW